ASKKREIRKSGLIRRHAAFWQRQTNVWRKITSRACRPKRLISGETIPAARRNFVHGYRRRKSVHLKKAKPLDGLLRQRPARYRDYPLFKPNPRRRPKLPIQLILNLRSIAALATIVAFAVA